LKIRFPVIPFPVSKSQAVYALANAESISMDADKEKQFF